MAVKTPIEQTEGLYFITFTCCQWLPLFEITDGYDTVYKWFDFLNRKTISLRDTLLCPIICMCLLIFQLPRKVLMQ
jgi:putative transposase